MNSSRLFCTHGSPTSPQIYKAPVTRALLQSEQAEGEVRLFARPKKKLSRKKRRTSREVQLRTVFAGYFVRTVLLKHGSQ
jgi:hypothetical protein